MFDFITELDFSILYSIQNLKCDFLDGLCSFLSVAFDKGIGWFAICAVLLIFKKTRFAGVVMLISVGLTFLTGELFIKNTVCRVRPCNQDLSVLLPVSRPSSFSFPSGHTGSSFAAAVSLFLCNKKLGSAALTLATVIALSRLYLFVHFPTDVLVGAILGTIFAVVCVILLRKAGLERKLSGPAKA